MLVKPNSPVNEALLRRHFELLRTQETSLSAQEQHWISRTLSIVPDHWRQVIDVGCGDGRVAHPLMERGVRVVGLDWSTTSMSHFQGEAIATDLRKK